MPVLTSKLLEAAKDARCISEEDWGSDRQIKAENKFFALVKATIPRQKFEELEAYCLKATTDEMINRGLELCGVKINEPQEA